MTISSQAITFANQPFKLLAEGAVFWPGESCLLVADLHFEKGSYLARSGSALPCFDTADTLSRLHDLISTHQPREVICLGDSFHDLGAFDRLSEHNLTGLRELMDKVQAWHWIMGNHDPALPEHMGGHRHETYKRGGILLAHTPTSENLPHMVGHYHPKTAVRYGGQKMRGPCFIHDERIMILPSFGSYTGGLDIGHAEIQKLFTSPATSYLLYRKKIWKLPSSMAA